MADYIYGYRTPHGRVMAHPDFTEQGIRSKAANPIRIPVSAIEPLPEPKPVLPTTPGSVVHVVGWGFLVLSDIGWGNAEHDVNQQYMDVCAWTLKFDAGAHDEGKTL